MKAFHDIPLPGHLCRNHGNDDPDKRNYIVSNDKIEATGWSPKYSLDDGIRELIKAYKIIINNDYSRFRNT